MSGRLRDDATVLVADAAEAGTVYGRGYFGTVASAGLTLDRFEAVYLAEMARLAVEDSRGRAVPWAEVYRQAARVEHGFGVRYIVYRDLRQRGYVVRATPPPAEFAVLPRGGVLHKTPSRYWVAIFSERVPLEMAQLFSLAERAQAAKKSLLLALVDEESDLTYYRLRRPSPTGSLEPKPLPTPTEGWLAHDRVTLFEPAAVESLGRGLAYGSRIGDRLEISLLEAGYLLETGQLTLRDARSRRTVSPDRFTKIVGRLDPKFRERLAAYRSLRSRHLVVKTGFKYGAHFRAYPRSPENAHARYLIQAVPDDHVAAWPEVAGAVRVAQGVRKEFLVASVTSSGEVNYLTLERVRP
ncbi:MAG: tRNA-intron lyase [Thermoplasmata archaeon]|nr:tRNA-intron lyase [Thermoplasmata archaeon]